MLRVFPEHVLLPEEQGVSLKQMPLSIAFAPRFRTKSKRPQVATLGTARADIVRAVAACKLLTPLGSPLFPYTLQSYRTLLHRAEQALGLEVGWGPHSPCAGFATDSRAEGWSFIEIREAGRWVADSSLRQSVFGHRLSCADHRRHPQLWFGTSSRVGRTTLDRLLQQPDAGSRVCRPKVRPAYRRSLSW